MTRVPGRGAEGPSPGTFFSALPGVAESGSRIPAQLEETEVELHSHFHRGGTVQRRERRRISFFCPLVSRPYLFDIYP